MTHRLHHELHRLFGLPCPRDPASPGQAPAPAPAACRALVLELAHPAEWEPLAQVWRGVQLELELPAPAIAVSGQEGFQLWFALAEPVASAQGTAFLEGLCRRWLAGLRPNRLRCWPSGASDGAVPPPVPAEQPPGGRWSAFVSADLAPVFAETPWLEIPPGDEAQARLLAALQPIGPAAFAAALTALSPPEATPAAPPGCAAPGAAVADPAAAVCREAGGAAAPLSDTPDTRLAPGRAPQDDPRAFLLAVMNDAAVPLTLRIEAAKALLAVPQRAGG